VLSPAAGAAAAAAAPPPPPASSAAAETTDASPLGLEGVLLPADSPLRTSAAAYSALLALAGGAARVKCGETALGRGLVVPRVPLPPVPPTLPSLLRGGNGGNGGGDSDAAARAGAFRSRTSSPTLAPPAAVTLTEDEDDEYERLFGQQGGAATAGGGGGGGGGAGASSSSSSSFAAAASTTTLDEDLGLEDYSPGAGGSIGSSAGDGSPASQSLGGSGSNNNGGGSPAGGGGGGGGASSSLLLPPSFSGLRRGEVVVAVPLTSALVVTDDPLDGPSSVGDRQQALWQVEHGVLPPALADFLQQGEARWDVRMAAWVLWLAGEAARDGRAAAAAAAAALAAGAARGDAAAGAAAAAAASLPSPSCPPLWSHYLRLMPPPDELCALLMYGRRDGEGRGGGSGGGGGGGGLSSSSSSSSSSFSLSYTPTAWLQLPSLIAEADSQRAWSEYMHDAYFAPIGDTGPIGGGGGGGGGMVGRAASASRAGGAAARQLRALRNGRGISPSRAASAWAQALVRSRSFSDDAGGEGLTLMVPFADLANHHPSAGGGTFHLSRDGRAFHLRALRGVAPRTELTIAYGERTPNDHLLRDYGFVVAANPYDRLDFGALLAAAGGGGGSAGGAGGAGGVAGGAAGVVLPGGGGRAWGVGAWGGARAAAGGAPPPAIAATTLNAASLLEYAGFCGDPNDPDTVVPLPAAAAAAASGGGLGGDGGGDDALARRQRLVRRRCALLSLPTRNVSPPQGPLGAGGGGGSAASALFAWATSNAAPPPPLSLHRRDAPAERAAAARLLAAVDARLASLPTGAQADEDLLRAGAADVEGDGSLGGRARGGARRALSPREATAVRARLEHKRLLLETRAVLRGYDAWLSQM